MTRERPIVSVTYAEMTAPVVRTQTVPVLAALRAAGREVDAIAFASPRRLLPGAERRAHARAAAAFTAATSRRPAIATYWPRTRDLASAGSALARILSKRGLREAVLHCRQARATLAAVAARDALRRDGARGPVVVYDHRGVRPEEYLVSIAREEADLGPEERATYDTYRERERAAYAQCDALVAVTSRTLRHLRATYGPTDTPTLVLANHATAVPDAETLRERARTKLGIAEHEVVLMYMGTLAAWQLPDSFLLLASAIRRHLDTARVLLITPDVARAREAVRDAGMKDALIRSAAPGSAHEWAAAGDYGLLLRAESIVNRVASPVKFGEYLAVGARPVMTAGVGDQSELCISERLGVVVGLQDAAAAAAAVLRDAAEPGMLGPAARERRRNWVAANISPQRTAARLLEFVTDL